MEGCELHRMFFLYLFFNEYLTFVAQVLLITLRPAKFRSKHCCYYTMHKYTQEKPLKRRRINYWKIHLTYIVVVLNYFHFAFRKKVNNFPEIAAISKGLESKVHEDGIQELIMEQESELTIELK